MSKEKHKKEENVSKEKDEKIDELTNDLKRLQAEFENYQKRNEKNNQEYKQYATADIITELLPVVDSLEQGIKHDKEFTQVYEQLLSILKKKGLEKIEVNVGDDFNHDIMDCLMQEENKEMEEGKVVNVLSTGYKLNGKILRTTKISINKFQEKNIENKKNEKENLEKNNGLKDKDEKEEGEEKN
jgi:molecular chaperone GrpE